MPLPDENRITYFASTDARNRRVPFGIKAKDRSRHMYVIGKTGMGKSTLLENLAIQDIQNGEGLAFMDPHGGTAEKLLDFIPEHRIKDVLYFAPFDMEYPIAFNVMEDVGPDKRHLVVAGLMSAFKKIWADAWSARMEYILQNTILALLEYPGSTMLAINKMLSDKDFRKKVVDNITDPSVKSFWVDEFAKYTDRFAAEATPAIQNKVGQFTSNPLIRNIIGQAQSSFDLRKMMDEKKILIINLSKGRVGEGNANLLGSMLITKIYLAAMSRADASETRLARLPNFYLYVDEFQSFANESFADILSEARKYKLNLTVAHQYIEQMSEEVRAAIFGNVGTMVVFRVGPFDADIFEKEFMPTFIAEDFVNLGFAQVYLKLMIDGVGSQPFSALTMPPIGKPPISYKQQVLLSSQEQFGGPRIAVEEEIAKQMLGEKGAEATPSRETPQNENKRGEPSRPRQSRERDMRPRAPENVEKIERVERRETVPVRSEVKEETKIETREVRHQAVRIESGVKEVLKQAGTEEHLTSLRSTLASVIGAVDPIVSKEKEVPVHLVLSKEVPKVVLERPVQESRKREEPNLYSKRSQNQGQNMEALRAVLQKLKNEESKEGIKDEAKEEPRIEEKVIVVKSDEVAKEEVVTSEKKKDFKPVEIPEDELRALLHVDRDNA